MIDAIPKNYNDCYILTMEVALDSANGGKGLVIVEPQNFGRKAFLLVLLVGVVAGSMHILLQYGMRIKGKVVCSADLMKYELSLMLVLFSLLEELSICLALKLVEYESKAKIAIQWPSYYIIVGICHQGGKLSTP